MIWLIIFFIYYHQGPNYLSYLKNNRLFTYLKTLLFSKIISFFYIEHQITHISIELQNYLYKAMRQANYFHNNKITLWHGMKIIIPPQAILLSENDSSTTIDHNLQTT
jgi:hypothetical protein